MLNKNKLKISLKTCIVLISIATLTIGCSSSSKTLPTPTIPTIPTAPSNLIVTSGIGQVGLSWSAATGATRYDVYDATTSGGPYSYVNSTSDTSMTITDLQNGAIYYFVVRAANIAGQGWNSNEASVVLPSTPPSPIDLTATSGNEQVTLTWKVSSSASTNSYNIYESTITGGPYTKIGSSLNTSYTVSGLSPLNGVTYYFIVTGVNSVGESGYSNEAGAKAYITNTYPIASRPSGIAIDASGNIWVTNNGGTPITYVTELNQKGGIVMTASTGYGPGGIAIDASGNVWVANSGSNSITELDQSGSIITTVTIPGGPYGIAIDVYNNVWVTSSNANTVTELLISSNFTSSQVYNLGTGANPVGVAIDSFGDVWVTGNSGSIVAELSPRGFTVATYPLNVYTPNGIAIDTLNNIWIGNKYGGIGPLTELNVGGSAITPTYNLPMTIWTTTFEAAGIAIDASGNIWIVDYGANPGDVIELSPKGDFINTYTVGSQPKGIAIDASGNVWVSNSNSNTVSEIVGVAAGPQEFPYSGPQFPGGGNL